MYAATDRSKVKNIIPVFTVAQERAESPSKTWSLSSHGGWVCIFSATQLFASVSVCSQLIGFCIIWRGFCFCSTRRSKLVSNPLVWANGIATCARWLMQVQEPSPPELGENHHSLRCESLGKHWFVSHCFEEDSAVPVTGFYHYCYLELEYWQVQRLIFGIQSLQPVSITMGFPEFLAIAYLSVNFNLVYSLFFILKSCQNFRVGHNLF